jgi:hypothetical protein
LGFWASGKRFGVMADIRVLSEFMGERDGREEGVEKTVK